MFITNSENSDTMINLNLCSGITRWKSIASYNKKPYEIGFYTQNIDNYLIWSFSTEEERDINYKKIEDCIVAIMTHRHI